MVTDMREQTKKVKTKLNTRPEAKDIVQRAVANYVARAAFAMSEAVGQDPEKYLKTRRQSLDARLEHIDPHKDPETYRDISSQRKVLDTLAVEEGRLAAPDLTPVIDRRAYKDKLDILRDAGMVVESSAPYYDLPHLADYEIMLLPREFELPQPFSQTMLKNPAKTNANAEAIYFTWSMQRAFKDRTDHDFRSVRPSKDDSSEEANKKRALLGFLGEAFAMEGVGIRSNALLSRSAEFFALAGGKTLLSREMRAAVKKSTERHHQEAVLAGKDLPKASYLTLLDPKVSLTEVILNEWLPENVYREALEAGSPDDRYIALSYKPNNGTRRIFMFVNAIAGLKGFLFSEYVRALQADGYSVRNSDIIDVKPYADKTEGLVGSKSGIRQQYHTKVGPIATAQKLRPRHLGIWPKVLAGCDCKDSDFTADLHGSSEHEYFCKHVYMLAATYMHQESAAGMKLINPIPLPSAELAHFQKVLEDQVLVERRVDGNVKPLNRGEQEPILISLAAQHPEYLTTDLEQSIEGVRRLYSHLLR